MECQSDNSAAKRIFLDIQHAQMEKGEVCRAN